MYQRGRPGHGPVLLPDLILVLRLPGSLIQLVSWVQRDGHEEVTLLTTARGRTKCRLGPKHEERNANLDCSFTDQSKARDALADAASLAAEELPSGEERKGGLG